MVNDSVNELALFSFTEKNFTPIFNAHWKLLYAIAYRRLQDAETAKDIVQEVFVYCWQQRDKIIIKTSVEAYLRKATQYQLIAHFRKLDVKDRSYAYIYERMVELETPIKDFLTEQELARALDTEFERMPDTMREIFKLRVKDYSVNEIASALNIAEKTVRNNITKGLTQLRKALSKEYPEIVSSICLALHILLT